MNFNPYGPEQETIKQAQRIHEVIKRKSLKTVCGYNYITNLPIGWLDSNALSEMMRSALPLIIENPYRKIPTGTRLLFLRRRLPDMYSRQSAI